MLCPVSYHSSDSPIENAPDSRSSKQSPASAPQLSLERVAHVAADGFLSCYVSGPLPYA